MVCWNLRYIDPGKVYLGQMLIQLYLIRPQRFWNLW